MARLRWMQIVAIPLVLGALAGCSATADSTRPTALQHLVVTPSGIEDLQVGQPIRLFDLVSFGEHTCISTGGWLPHYPKDSDNAGGQKLDPFDVVTKGGEVSGAITAEYVWSREIATPEGIRVGSSESSVRAAYPHATIDALGSTNLYIVHGGLGQLVVEVAARNTFGVTFWPDRLLGRVLWMDVLPTDVDPRSIAFSNEAGQCPATAVAPDVVRQSPSG